jgi:hypothetical protein
VASREGHRLFPHTSINPRRTSRSMALLMASLLASRSVSSAGSGRASHCVFSGRLAGGPSNPVSGARSHTRCAFGVSHRRHNVIQQRIGKRCCRAAGVVFPVHHWLWSTLRVVQIQLY